VNVGSTITCTPTVTGTGSFSSAVTFASSSTSIATVDGTGKVTGVAAGTVTITATSTQDSTKSGPANVTVAAAASTITAVTLACPASVNVGSTITCTPTVTGTGSFSSTVSYTSSNTSIATVDGTGKVTGVAAGTVTITATSTQDTTKSGTSAAVSVTAAQPPTATISANPTTIVLGQSSVLTWACKNAISCTASGSWTGTLAMSGTQTVTPASVGTFTYTLTATAADTRASTTWAVVTVTAPTPLTIAIDPTFKLPNGQIYSRYGTGDIVPFVFTGVQAGDIWHGVSSTKGDNPSTLTQGQTTGEQNLIMQFNYNIPLWFKFYLERPSTGMLSNVVWILYRGSQNMAIVSASGIYYSNAGNTIPDAYGCDVSVLVYKLDGTATETIPCMDATNHTAPMIGVDEVNHYLVQLVSGDGNSAPGGIALYDLGNLNLNGALTTVNSILFGAASTTSFALATNGGVSCATQDVAGTLSCVKNSPRTQQPQPPVITASNLNQPLALTMPDASHVVVYCTGDQTLRWFTLDVVAGTATPSGTFAIQGLTNVDAQYQSTYSTTGGWFVVQFGSTLGVMGQLVNGDGTVDQVLVAVDNTAKTQIGSNFTLPRGTTLITADSLNGAFAVEYPDTTVDPPVMRYGRYFPGTGNFLPLTSTSTLVPGAGFLAVGNLLPTFNSGQGDFPPNQ